MKCYIQFIGGHVVGLHYGDVRMGNINFPRHISRQPDSQDTSQGGGTSATPATVENESKRCQNTSDDSRQVCEGVSREGEKTTTQSAVPSMSDSHATKTLSDIANMIEKRKNFFKHLGYNFNNSFFEKLKKCNKKGECVYLDEVRLSSGAG